MMGLEAVAEKQYGLISREQALSVMSEEAIWWRVSTGSWERILRGVYRFRGAPESWEQTAMGLLLLSGPTSALSHRTAGFLFGLAGVSITRGQPPQLFDVTVVRPARKDIAPNHLHRVRAADYPTQLLRGLRVTTLVRTVVDLFDVTVETAFDQALNSARLTDKAFDLHFEPYVRSLTGRPCTQKILSLLERRPQRLDSPLEIDVLQRLEQCGLPRGIAGYSVFDNRRFIMKVDFAWPDRKLALHCDGYETHSQRARFERDARQRTTLASLGWKNVIVTRRAMHEPWWVNALQKALT